MARTVLTSIARTCSACGASNTVVAATTEIRPAWRMNCSRCGAPMGTGKGVSRAGNDAGITPAAIAAGTRKTGAGRATADVRRRRRGLASRCCSGLHMAAGAALGVACTVLLLLDLRGDPTRPHGDPAGLAAARERSIGPVSGVAADPLEAVRQADRQAGRTAAEWDAAVEAALEAELARLEATIGDDAPHLAAGDGGTTMLDPEAAALVEAALDLSRRDRHELQRRLKLAEHDPRMVDGIFGPATRAAIARWQSAVGLPPTGYFDEQALALLQQQTDEQFRAWQVAEERDRRRKRTSSATIASSMPTATPASAACQRTWSGEIAYGQNVFCDFRGLRENVAQLFRTPERS